MQSEVSEFNQSFEGLSLAEMLTMREQMDKTLGDLSRGERQATLEQIQQQVKQFNFLPFEIFPRIEKVKAKVADKYYDPDTGQSWSGRGKPPRWIQDKDREQFLIRNEPELDPQEARETGLLGAMAGAGVIRS